MDSQASMLNAVRHLKLQLASPPAGGIDGTAEAVFDRDRLVSLMETFQFAIIESMSPEHADNPDPQAEEDRLFFCGMATIASTNCQMLLQMAKVDEHKHAQAYRQFLQEAEEFAKAIMDSGLIKDQYVDLQ